MYFVTKSIIYIFCLPSQKFPVESYLMTNTCGIFLFQINPFFGYIIRGCVAVRSGETVITVSAINKSIMAPLHK